MPGKTTLFFIFFALICLTHSDSAVSQEKWWKEKNFKNPDLREKYDLCKRTFRDIGNGFSNKNINYINQYFDEQVYLNIISTDRGYYSPNQAEIILTEFMDYFRISEFKYITSKRYNSYAFVNGKYTYRLGNGKRNLDVTISLKYFHDKWFVDQININ
ncbi:MAG: DUF4783 domain-containing protein [Bacteroidetes bacterium]|nr:DUF4783 domain-containing protein [Bacteroidota bacterium]